MWRCILIMLTFFTNNYYAFLFPFDVKFKLEYENYLNPYNGHSSKLSSKKRDEGFSYAYNEYGLSPTLSEYDFIIVGSGPAGCVLAHRLTENPEWKVLLLEAGKRETIVNDVPLFAAYFQSTEYNWGYVAEKQDGMCWGMEDEKCGFPRGKALGGTSVINYMIYNRGNKRDFNQWAKDGNYGWSYDEVLPYFKKSERAHLRGLENSTYHNRYGLLSIEDPPFRTQLADAFVKASKQAGYAQVDYNGPSQVGTSFVQANTLRGLRDSAARSFIDPILKHRPNLHILTEARVTNVLINPNTKIAYGVQYIKNKKVYKVNARNEVVLSAGTFNSAQLLMLSGIGRREELQRINVPLIQELNVGQNMYDHVSHFGPTFIVNTTGKSLNTAYIGLPQMKELLFYGKGILSVIGGVEALNFIKTKNSKTPADFPDAELIFVPGSLASDEGTGLRAGMRIKKSLYNQVYKPLESPSIDHWSVMVLLFHPKSKGYMELKDNNPFHWPRFYPNYFQYEDDVETLLNGIKEAIRIAQSPAMQKIGARIYDVPLPNCAHLHFGSDNYWRCSIRTLSCTLHHQIGTCKMGPSSDPLAVVDPELKVHGIHRLRVVDTSIIPIPTTSHTNAASYMIGEKAADMIKSFWHTMNNKYI